MRSAKEAGNSPYVAGTICYIEARTDVTVSQMQHTRKSDLPCILEVYQRMLSKESTLYAVWPGNWRSDFFIIDDFDAFAKEFKLV